MEDEVRPEAGNSQRSTLNVMGSSKEEEGPVKGEFWAVLRALTVLTGMIVFIGFVFA